MLIKFREQVPSIYPSASRDFQYLGWLIDIVLNSVKHNVDDLYDLPNSKTDPRLTELLAMTLGFKVKRNYDQNQLQALVAALPRILKYKGTMTAVNMAGNALIAASGAIGSFDSEVKDGELTVVLPKSLIDISLFTDLLPYILPAGMTCHIVRKNQLKEGYATKLVHQNSLLAEWVPDLAWDNEKQTTVGLANMFNTGISSTEYANFAMANPELYSGWIIDFYTPKTDDLSSSSKEALWLEQYNCISIKTAFDICSHTGKYKSDRYYIIATISSIKDQTLGKMTIKDSTGTIYATNIYGADGETRYGELDDKVRPKVGDKVLLYANFYTNYGDYGDRPLNDELMASNRILNTGLLDNSMIPTLTQQFYDPYSEELVKNVEESTEGENL